MVQMLAEAEIDVSVRSDLFDVLDVDMSGELELDEVIGGLMMMRGPITKSDMVAVRLKVGFIVDLVQDVIALQISNHNELMELLGKQRSSMPPSPKMSPIE